MQDLRLYAVNAKDQPLLRDGPYDYRLFSIYQRDISANAWLVRRLSNAGGDEPLTFDEFPSLLAGNWQPTDELESDHYGMTVASHSTGELAIVQHNTGTGTWWDEQEDIHSPAGTETRFSRIAKTLPSKQWIGCEWLFHSGSQDRIEKTSDGWLTFTSVPSPTGLPVEAGFYSLATVPASGAPTAPMCAVGVISTDPELGNSLDPHLPYVHCDGLYLTTNDGLTWSQMTVPGWPQDACNVQIDWTGNLISSTLYVLGAGVTGDIPQAFCLWANCNQGNFTWHTSDLGEMNPNIYVFDLNEQPTQMPPIHHILFAATSEKLYYADHDGISEDIPWEVRMGTGDQIIRTKGFRSVKTNRCSPASEYAVVGEVAAYYTNDRGEHWSEIQGNGQLIAYPEGGARQRGGALVSLHARTPFTSQSPYAPVFVEIAPRQSGLSAGQFETTVQLGYTWDRSHVKLAAAQDGLSYATAHIAAFSDPFVSHAGGNTIGIVYYSLDDGMTWQPGTWLNREFSAEQNVAPIPSDLYVHPTLNRIYITFWNAGEGTGNGIVPAFAYSDDFGATWQIPGGEFPLEWSEKYIAASKQLYQPSRRIFVSSGSSVFMSTSEGESWTRVSEPTGGFGHINSLCGSLISTSRVAVAGSHLFVTMNSGSRWDTYNFPENRSPDKLCGDLEYPGTFWAIFDNWNGEKVLRWTNNYGATWRFRASWSYAACSGGPSTTDLYIERLLSELACCEDGETRRVFWSGTANADGYLPSPPNPASGVRYYEYRFLPPDYRFPPRYVVANNGTPLYIPETAIIPPGDTLIIEPGVEVLVGSECALDVQGTLILGSDEAEATTFNVLDNGQEWSGISVSGSATFTNCVIEGATTGVLSDKATELTLTNCTFQNNEFGVHIYAPEDAGPVTISGCTFQENTKTAIELIGTADATISECRIEHNGEVGISLAYSFATIAQNEIIENGSFGLECFGSSPVVYCNTFRNNAAGEVGLWKESYPILWDAKEETGGANSFTNDFTTLITMESSSPIIMKGMNNFYVGSSGYFMVDVSGTPIEHILDGNYWNPDLELALLYPSDPNIWVWGGVEATPSECSVSRDAFGGAPAALYEQGLAAELSDNFPTAQSVYTQLITQHSDTLWAILAASRLFETQRQADTAYTALQSFFWSHATAHPADTLLVKTVRALATRLWVEARDFNPALNAYQQTLVNPPSPVDSVYAALDYALTALQAQYENSGRGTLDSYSPTVCASSIAHLMNNVHSAVPKAPPTQHAGYRTLPNNFVLEQNYPNPFNAMTMIRYYLPEANHVQIEVFNIAGQHVATLNDEFVSEGFHVAQWDASVAASGVYVYQIQAGKFVDSKKMVLIR